eukprot:GILK01003681.1.p1 GENE.GILK01003681.1~~GILK01003681.1.p1  ORF type:complete len:801 (+),score=143.21 GILK01003681.1:62-2404(+)
MEAQILEELFELRRSPQDYAIHLENVLPFFRDLIFQPPDSDQQILTEEGVEAVREAIQELRMCPSLPPFIHSEGLKQAARDHVQDIGARGIISHAGSDTSNPDDRVSRYGRYESSCGENLSFGQKTARSVLVQLLVDDGVQGRGHRNNLLATAFTHIGVACGPHTQTEHCCVMNFTDSFYDNPDMEQPSPARYGSTLDRSTVAFRGPLDEILSDPGEEEDDPSDPIAIPVYLKPPPKLAATVNRLSTPGVRVQPYRRPKTPPKYDWLKQPVPLEVDFHVVTDFVKQLDDDLDNRISLSNLKNFCLRNQIKITESLLEDMYEEAMHYRKDKHADWPLTANEIYACIRWRKEWRQDKQHSNYVSRSYRDRWISLLQRFKTDIYLPATIRPQTVPILTQYEMDFEAARSKRLGSTQNANLGKTINPEHSPPSRCPKRPLTVSDPNRKEGHIPLDNTRVKTVNRMQSRMQSTKASHPQERVINETIRSVDSSDAPLFGFQTLHHIKGLVNAQAETSKMREDLLKLDRARTSVGSKRSSVTQPLPEMRRPSTVFAYSEQLSKLKQLHGDFVVDMALASGSQSGSLGSSSRNKGILSALAAAEEKKNKSRADFRVDNYIVDIEIEKMKVAQSQESMRELYQPPSTFQFRSDDNRSISSTAGKAPFITAFKKDAIQLDHGVRDHRSKEVLERERKQMEKIENMKAMSGRPQFLTCFKKTPNFVDLATGKRPQFLQSDGFSESIRPDALLTREEPTDVPKFLLNFQMLKPIHKDRFLGEQYEHPIVLL